MFSCLTLRALCLVILACCGVGLSQRQAQPKAIPQAQETDTQTQSVARSSGTWRDEPNADFYQTIIKNNLFAPLGTDLNPTPVPGANMRLVATFVSEDALRSTALIQNETTGRHYMLSIGGVIGDFTLMRIQPKQVTLDHHGKKPVELHLPDPMFLNPNRR